MSRDRRPTMQNALQTLISYGVPVNSIIDIGVQVCTKPLIQLFPDKKHFLFEPIDHYFPSIRSAYQNLTFELSQIALSKKDGHAWQVGLSRDNSGQITHSHISDSIITKEQEPQLIECKPVKKAKLDTLFPQLNTLDPFLLKIDVDGHERAILEGAQNTLPKASIIIIEAPLPPEELIPRAQFIIDKGFKLFDIVDLSYYYGVLSQVDLIFVRQDIVNQIDALRPWQTRNFSWDAWAPLNEEHWTKPNETN